MVSFDGRLRLENGNAVWKAAITIIIETVCCQQPKEFCSLAVMMLLLLLLLLSRAKKWATLISKRFFWVVRPLSMDVHWQSYFFTWNWSIKNSNELKINARFFIPFQCTTLFSFNFDRKWKKISRTTFTQKINRNANGRKNKQFLGTIFSLQCSNPVVSHLFYFISIDLYHLRKVLFERDFSWFERRKKERTFHHQAEQQYIKRDVNSIFVYFVQRQFFTSIKFVLI